MKADPLVDRLVSAVIGSEAVFARSAVHDANIPTYLRRLDMEAHLSAVLAVARRVSVLDGTVGELRDALAAADAASQEWT